MSEPGEHLHDWVDCERASLRAIIGDEPLPRQHERNLRWMCPGCGADEPRLLLDQVAVITAERDAYRDALHELVERPYVRDGQLDTAAWLAALDRARALLAGEETGR